MKKHEKLLYQLNVFPGGLAKSFLVINTFQTVITLNGIDVVSAGIRTMEIILLNIVFSFLAFITSAEMKRYSMRWSLIGLALGFFQFVRIPLISPTLSGTNVIIITVSLCLAGILLIAASLLSVRNTLRYRLALKE